MSKRLWAFSLFAVGFATIAWPAVAAQDPPPVEDQQRAIPDLVAYRLLFRSLANHGEESLSSTSNFTREERRKLATLAKGFLGRLQIRDRQARRIARDPKLDASHKEEQLARLRQSRDDLTVAFLRLLSTRLSEATYAKLINYCDGHVKSRVYRMPDAEQSGSAW